MLTTFSSISGPTGINKEDSKLTLTNIHKPSAISFPNNETDKILAMERTNGRDTGVFCIFIDHSCNSTPKTPLKTHPT